MFNRIIRIAVAVGALFILGGCVRKADLMPESEENYIGFSAGQSPLLRDASTKSTTESFSSNGDTFAVFGERVTSADEHSQVFNGTTVSHHYIYDEIHDLVTEDYWDYESHRYWYWASSSDRYDFVAVSPALQRTNKIQSVDNLKVSTPYDILTGVDSEDILAAAYRRNGNVANPISTVQLSFAHMGSAVSISLANSSENKSVTINSIWFKNLVVKADATVSLDNYGRPYLSWENLQRSASKVREQQLNTVVGCGGEESGGFQIMIPQELSINAGEAYQPTLVINYTPNGGAATEHSILLREVMQSDGVTPLDRWEMGHKYTYSISMRLDGGLLVTVTTTPWDVPVEAETPGILI